MAASPDFVSFACDLFADLGPVRSRRMFGGAGLFLGDAMFALIADDTLYMKTDDALARAYAAEGSDPFTYQTRKGARGVMAYMRLPEAAMDDPDLALDWARKSLIPAEAAALEKRARKARKKAG